MRFFQHLTGCSHSIASWKVVCQLTQRANSLSVLAMLQKSPALSETRLSGHFLLISDTTTCRKRYIESFAKSLVQATLALKFPVAQGVGSMSFRVTSMVTLTTRLRWGATFRASLGKQSGSLWSIHYGPVRSCHRRLS